MPVPILCLTIFLTALAAYYDWRTGEVPNAVTVPALLLAPACSWWLDSPQAALFSLLGAIACGLPTYLFFRTGGLGGGDVKLFAALGALTGPILGTEILMASVLLACGQALVLVIRRRQLRQVTLATWQTVKNPFLPRSRRVELPRESLTTLRLGPAILVGTLLVLVRA